MKPVTNRGIVELNPSSTEEEAKKLYDSWAENYEVVSKEITAKTACEETLVISGAGRAFLCLQEDLRRVGERFAKGVRVLNLLQTQFSPACIAQGFILFRGRRNVDPIHQYAYSPYCSLYISQGAEKENLFNSQEFFGC